MRIVEYILHNFYAFVNTFSYKRSRNCAGSSQITEFRVAKRAPRLVAAFATRQPRKRFLPATKKNIVPRNGFCMTEANRGYGDSRNAQVHSISKKYYKIKCPNSRSRYCFASRRAHLTRCLHGIFRIDYERTDRRDTPLMSRFPVTATTSRATRANRSPIDAGKNDNNPASGLHRTDNRASRPHRRDM